MAGNGKHFVWQDYLTAYQTAWYGLVELDEPVRMINKALSGEDTELLRVDTFTNSAMSQEETYCKKEAIDQLSEEAKEIIDLVFNAPAEIMACFITPKYNKISKEKIHDFLLDKGWNQKIIKKCFAELRDLCNEFH